MKIRLAAPLQCDSIVDGDGIRTVIWTQGCSHNCPGCHNPETHSFNAGYEIDTQEIKQKLSFIKQQDGVTLSGGDPFFQAEAVNDIATYCQQIGLNVWCYTGFTFEQLFQMSQAPTPKGKAILDLLQHINVLVDVKFVPQKKS